MKFTKWQNDLLETLCWRLRVVSITQLCRHSKLRRRVIQDRTRKLRKAGFVALVATAVHNWHELSPLVRWPSHTWADDFTRLPWLLEKRWGQMEFRRDQVVWLTPAGAAHIGGRNGGLRQRLQVQHDLGVAAIYFSISSKLRSRWVSEDVLRECGGLPAMRRIPDAALATDGAVSTVIEFGGQYDKQKLKRFHLAAKRGGVRYDFY